MEETHLMLIHLGPVQDFISAARRSHDLYFGSWLLSELAKAAARKIVEEHKDDISCLIFPAPESSDRLKDPQFNSPNRVLAVVKTPPEELAKRVWEAVLERLKEIREEAYRQVRGEFDRSVAEQQVEDFPEFFWASYPLDAGYERARSAVEALLAACKNTRDFAKAAWGSNKPKCFLCGVRESVIPEDPEENLKRMNEADLWKNYRIRPGERLCGVCLLKRNGTREEGRYFFSTSHVAALPLLDTLTEEYRPLVEEYLSKLKELGVPDDALKTVDPPHPAFGSCDGEFLFEERLREFFKEDKEKLKKAQEALRDFLEKAFNGNRPFPYYALLLADGDHMGKVIDAQSSPEGHQKLSRKQSEFASEARKIVEKHRGALIYSGGDDVLALVPLHKLLKCARTLSDTFRAKLSEFKAKDGDEEIPPSLSMGIVIAHHLTPLSDVLELARKAEKAAKELEGKNALAVLLSKRSGEERTVRGHWGELDQQLEWLVNLHREDAIPDGAAYELKELVRRLKTEDKELRGVLEKVAQAEFERILLRKRAKRGAEVLEEKIVKGLKRFVGEDSASIEKIEQLADSLIIAGELARALDLAERASATSKEVRKG
ncbi:type III-B CRISPR-associated protein Cas10/Cmr2 [Desulfothermobacter acidiphilus]|uniref:type III-B CRISPR-associated protein Cas10/Cmr2 n=1 Tax=Desulfothermobacter acidiphilus TaxID=1938353 RepID=UPI003F8C239E